VGFSLKEYLIPKSNNPQGEAELKLPSQRHKHVLLAHSKLLTLPLKPKQLPGTISDTFLARASVTLK